MEGRLIPAGRGSVAGRTIVEGRIVHISDVLADPEFTFTEAARIGGVRTMLGVPLMREGVPMGVLNLQRKAVRPFTQKQIDLVTTFADEILRRLNKPVAALRGTGSPTPTKLEDASRRR